MENWPRKQNKLMKELTILKNFVNDLHKKFNLKSRREFQQFVNTQ